MADELKNRSFRISDDTTEKFRQLCSEFDNQNVALNALISAYEVQQAKAVITERATDISDYDTHLQALQSAFLHSIELNENAETRIRQEFQRQLESKDGIISELQEHVKQAETVAETAKQHATMVSSEADARIEQAEKEMNSLQEKLAFTDKQVSELSENLIAVKSQVIDKQQIIDNLNQQINSANAVIQEAKEATEKAKQAETELNAVKLELSEVKKLYEIEAKELTQQLALQTKEAEADKKSALADLKEKYVAELDELRQKVQALKEENLNIKSMKKSV